MRKTDKKIERALVEALTEVCEAALDRVPGFLWITHFVNYSNFPDSLMIVSVFESDEQLRLARVNAEDRWLSTLIQQKLTRLDVSTRKTREQIRFDTEEACQREDNGNWHERYR